MLADLIERATQKGSVKQFDAWVSRQPSCLSGDFSEYHDGVGRCVTCHVRRVKFGSGVSRKPSYFAVPMTFQEHAVQHGKRGERGCLLDAGWDVSEAEAKLWFERQALRYLTLWLEG